ncbi:MAG TPA: GH1 family beta-glucosidase [Flexivirga sp.]|uniref:GH1 family beta-glucosidase n=1 Tax=Flexivirga sp. TaxID=1962927 RepID=UPI002B6EC7C3|nr:GH1 family beta-glucosidase [Flexivirga sp.]HWC23777.1 GH1 family beta-glucosidase [Flexivirga sp.]
MTVQFPADFIFGAATASYQIEGAVAEDGRTPSIWDTYSHTPGKVQQGQNGDVACDHYHRYGEDIALMKQLGLDSYRLSLAWPRIKPDDGPVNAAGLAFYDKLVDELLAAGIDPAVTLYHWDLPQTLEDKGGWRVRDTAERFAEYSAVAAEHLGDRVKKWITLNEPFCSSILGYSEGVHAPGAQEGEGALKAAHHLMLGHGLATQRIRSVVPDAQVGITLNLASVQQVSDSPADAEAARRNLLIGNLIFTDPVLAGKYPEHAREVWAPITDFSFIQDGDLETAHQPLDFLGVNFYFPSRPKAVAHDEPDPAKRVASDLGFESVIHDGEYLTEMGWPVDASAFTDLLTWLGDTYGDAVPPIYITENGIACPDVVGADGRVDDQDRIRYVSAHLKAVKDAMDKGVDVRGYYVWSLMDNFEWARGYQPRFGVVHVDYDTLKRTPKASFDWYRGVIQSHEITAG